MIPRLANRTPRTRTVRGHMGQPRLESLAAEFALLAQRRSRAIHEIETLDQQRAAAAAGFARLQKRIAWLTERMEALNPELPDAEVLPQPEPPLVYCVRPRKQPVAGNDTLAAIGRQWIAAHPTSTDHPIRTRRGKRL